MLTDHPITRFNVRVYGFLFNPKGEVLVADELIKGLFFTKFPGGGLDLGEGPREGLAREFMEETGVVVKVEDHLYTTDFFLPSAFDQDSQLIAIYYQCRSDFTHLIKASTRKFDFTPEPDRDAESFRWVPLDQLLQEEHLTLPSDIKAVEHLIRWRQK